MYCPIRNGECMYNCAFGGPMGCDLVKGARALPIIQVALQDIATALAELDPQVKIDMQRETR